MGYLYEYEKFMKFDNKGNFLYPSKKDLLHLLSIL